MPLRSVVGAIGLAVAALISLAGPIGYATVSYLEKAEILSFRARLNADKLAKYIYSHDKLWQYQRVRLAEIMELPRSKTIQIRQRVIDLSGKVVLEEGAQLSGPLLRRRSPIVVNGAAVAHIEALTSLTPFFINVAWISLASLAIGLGAYLALRVLPLRVLDRTLDELKTQNRRFAAAVNNMPIGLVMFNADKRLVVGNDRYREMYGLPYSVTKPGTHLREMLEHRLATANFEGETPADYVERILKLVEQKETSVRVVQLGDGRTINIIHHPTEEGWIGTHEDITERENLHLRIARQNEILTEQERRLKTQNLQLDAALENISHGLSMFDRDQHLVLCNERYLEMYGLSPSQAMPGTSFLQLLELRFACGSYPKGPPPAAYLAHLAQQLHGKAPRTRVTQLNDGRFITVTTRSMPDGGWVATHEDITDLRHREELLRAQNLRFDTALNNMSHGLCMFDAQKRLVVCNEKFAQIYDLPSDLMRPGTSLQQIVQHRIDRGLYASDDCQTKELFAAVSENVPLTRVTELTDGRAIVIKHQPMPDGGYVATHEDITEQRKIEARIKHMAHHDALTDLPNRALVRERLEHAISQTSQGGGLAVFCLDLDRFKEVNDTLGHPVGDALLRSVADRLRGCIRQGDTAARLGGDEFAIIQVAPNQPTDSTALAARIIQAISAAHDLDGQDIVVGTSIGIAMFPEDGTDADQLLRNADLALYRAKSEGRGNCRFFEKGMDERMQARRTLERDLRTAITKGEFELYYQPLIGLERNEVTGFEALLRWNHPERGQVSPADFIPLAEETGLITPIGEWVLRQACAEAVTWPAGIKIAVNLSPVQFMSGNLVAVVLNALTASGLAASRLELEITETVLLQNAEATLATLHRLRDLGVGISMAISARDTRA